jgi:hypothetical protein
LARKTAVATPKKAATIRLGSMPTLKAKRSMRKHPDPTAKPDITGLK